VFGVIGLAGLETCATCVSGGEPSELSSSFYRASTPPDCGVAVVRLAAAVADRYTSVHSGWNDVQISNIHLRFGPDAFWRRWLRILREGESTHIE
jgi:hypothetical protein